jgi:hypothetical protein
MTIRGPKAHGGQALSPALLMRNRKAALDMQAKGAEKGGAMMRSWIDLSAALLVFGILSRAAGLKRLAILGLTWNC